MDGFFCSSRQPLPLPPCCYKCGNNVARCTKPKNSIFRCFPPPPVCQRNDLSGGDANRASAPSSATRPRLQSADPSPWSSTCCRPNFAGGGAGEIMPQSRRNAWLQPSCHYSTRGNPIVQVHRFSLGTPCYIYRRPFGMTASDACCVSECIPWRRKPLHGGSTACRYREPLWKLQAAHAAAAGTPPTSRRILLSWARSPYSGRR